MSGTGKLAVILSKESTIPPKDSVCDNASLRLLDRHDMCYSACNDPRKYCDDSFRDCMVKYCDTDPGIKLGYDGRSTDVCVSAAEMMYLGVETFGCTSYLEALSLATSSSE